MKVLDCYKFNEQHDVLEFYKYVSADTSAILSLNLNIVCSRMQIVKKLQLYINFGLVNISNIQRISTVYWLINR